MIRGQEIDYYAQAPRKQPDFADLYPADLLEKVDVGVPADGLERLRANYAGEASNVDYWFGKILDKVAELGLNENTVVVFLSDHGALLGEQGQFVKGPERLRTQVTHIPLLVRTPDGEHRGKRVSGFVQIDDLVPTILGRLNLKPPPRVTGEDLWPYVAGELRNTRDHVASAFGYVASVRTKEWNYPAVWNREKIPGEIRTSAI